ncbi:MAG: DUF669 domain-containing protein [Mycetocola sp.]
MSNEMIVDLSNYKDRVGARVAPGTYKVQVEDAEQSKSSNNNPMVNLWFRIVGGEFDGQTIVDRLTLTEKSLFRVVGFMQAIGMPTQKKRYNLNIQKFVGKTLMIDVADGDPYNGRIKSEVRGYSRPAKAEGAAATGADLEVEEIEDEFDAKAPDTTPKETSATEIDLPGDTTPVDDDDVDLDDIQL